MTRVSVIDSHTEGEPTRVVIAGGPVLGKGSVAEQATRFREAFDWFRSAIVNEPRGWDAMVGALLVPPEIPGAVTGVIFFNNVGLLHACGHGTIGVGATLAHLKRIGAGAHIMETPVGAVTMHLSADGAVAIENVASYRHAAGVRVSFAFEGRACTVRGDVAWGGNWFFLCGDHEQEVASGNIERLTAFSWAIRRALERDGVTGAQGAAIDHIELFGPAARADCDSKNFVLCPGGAYDRSPCGTGTSAKMACLFAEGALAPGREWRQESIIGSRFVGGIREERAGLIPTIRGGAYITSEATLLIDERDPFRHGIPGLTL